MVPLDVSAANASLADEIETKPPPVGALLGSAPRLPHDEMTPLPSRAAKAPWDENSEAKPLPVGGPGWPPYWAAPNCASPHA